MAYPLKSLGPDTQVKCSCFKVTGQSSIELFATKKQSGICQPNNACIEQTNYSQVELLKYHRYDIETREHSLAIDPLTRVHLTEPHINFCPVGSLVGIETYDIR